jgi:hypothetical protein
MQSSAGWYASTMRRETLWYLIAVAWWIDSALAWHRGRGGQALVAFVFACCFCLVGFLLRHRAGRHG